MLLIIGLDGATWDLLDPWLQAGRLPNLARLRERGAYGALASTMPPATLPSWTTFMTGVNPGRHGIFDFTRREPGAYEVRFVNATYRKVPSVWSRLSDAQRRVCVLGLPGTYPPEPLNGCMVSGFDTPVTTRADASFVRPAELASLVEASGGFPFADFQEFRVGAGWHRMALERLLRGIEVKTRLAETLLRREPWDCFLLLFGESDTVAHHFWRFHDPRSPRYDSAGAADVGDAIKKVYEALDAAIGQLTSVVADANVMLVSDHGFGGAGDKAIYLNRWLQAAGLQRRTESAPGGRLAGQAKRLALQMVPASLQARLFRWQGGRWASRLESRARFAGIDWAATHAFSEELNYFPSVWLNVKGRDRLGQVAPADYERVRDDVCLAATELRDPVHGRPIVARIWRREELYSGPWVPYAPDLVLELNLDSGYSYSCLPSSTVATGTLARRLSPADLTGGKLTGMSGSHRPNGVFLLSGPQVLPSGLVEGLRMVDMTPSILSLCGIEPPAEFDGVTVQSIVSRRRRQPIATSRAQPTEQVYGREEEAEIASRLADLGYLQ
jgi:predicted AlkP superfamily phosphohydrolase/phosphomutase